MSIFDTETGAYLRTGILDEKGNEIELTTLIAMSDVIRVNIYNETVYITVR